MITRLKVSGFKNLVDIDVRFGPFTCIAGANGSGKSNLLDAIHFLSLLAEKTFYEAAREIRGDDNKTSDILSLFHRVGDAFDNEMSFEVEMIIPQSGSNPLGVVVETVGTRVRYELALAYRKPQHGLAQASIELISERLVQLGASNAGKNLLFSYSDEWLQSVCADNLDRDQDLLLLDRDSPTVDSEGGMRERVLTYRVNRDEQKTIRIQAALPRSTISTMQVYVDPALSLARDEMASWRTLNLNPAKLREPSELDAPPTLGSDGVGLPAILNKLIGSPNPLGESQEQYAGRVDATISNRLSHVVGGFGHIHVDSDHARQLLSLQVEMRDGTVVPARALSDGTLRYIAYMVLYLDPDANGVICIEEPESGLHPSRIESLVGLFQDMAVDTQSPVEPGNPLRQVIITTHSPVVVGQVPDDSIIIAQIKDTVVDGRHFNRASFGYLKDTWRATAPEATKYDVFPTLSLAEYVNPVGGPLTESSNGSGSNGHSPRVFDRSDVRKVIFGE